MLEFTAKTWTKKGYYPIGFATKENNINIANLKEGQELYRYETNTTKMGNFKPLILIDRNKKLCYFLRSTESENIEFESKGVKIQIWN